MPTASGGSFKLSGVDTKTAHVKEPRHLFARVVRENDFAEREEKGVHVCL